MSIPTNNNPPHVHEVMNNKNPSHDHTMDTNIDPKHSYWHNLAEEFSRDINTQHDYRYAASMNDSDNPYELLSARLRALEAELAAVKEQVSELDDELHEAWLGGTD